MRKLYHQDMDRINFSYFLEKFPTQPFPITLRADTYEELDGGKDPLPTLLIEQYLLDENEEDDGLTEHIACLRLPAHDNYEAIVYWRAGLLNYEYILKTYTKDGVGVIDSQVIAGTVVENEMLIESVATINEERIIYIATGASDIRDNSFDSTKNKVKHFEIVDDGTIVES
jgi:hypothetical protein